MFVLIWLALHLTPFSSRFGFSRFTLTQNIAKHKYFKTTVSDLQRLSEMKTRSLVMPILILDAMVPGQRLSFQSSDPKFHKLVEHALSSKQTNEIGMIGFNPHTGKPLNMGVSSQQPDSMLFVDVGVDVDGCLWVQDYNTQLLNTSIAVAFYYANIGYT